MKIQIKSLMPLLAFAFFTINLANAQYKCGVTYEAGMKLRAQMQTNRIEMKDYVFERNAITYVPVRFYLVAKSDGTGRTSERAGLQALCRLNEAYLDQNIQFYLKEFKYINSNSIYSDPESFSGSNAIAGQMVYNAINIFIIHEIATEGVLAYYQPDAGPNGNDWVVCLEGQAGQDLVLPHEVGHFFSLNHTFYGWECNGGWTPNDGNPVGAFTPCGAPAERVNGSNCNTAADQICDTPADYMFPNNNCAYTLDVKDVNGQLLSPDIHNFMNYVYGCDAYHFTDGQKEEIQNSLFSFNRNYIRPNYTPNLATVDGSPTITSPQQSETIPTYNAVTLQWTAVDGADKYLIEIATSGQETRRIIANTNSVTLNNLSASKSYLWKVMAFNEYSTCGGFSSQKIFKTGSVVNATSSIPKVSSWNIAPNPVRVGSSFFINLNSSEAVKATVSLTSMTGQLIQEFPETEFKSGESSFEVPTDNLSTGIYFVTLRSKNNFQTQRVSVID